MVTVPTKFIDELYIDVVARDLSFYGGYAGFFGVKPDGTLWSLGTNEYGQCGLGDTTPRAALVSTGVGGVDRAWSDGRSVHIKKSDGTIWGCGLNSGVGYSLLGDGTNIQRTSFVEIMTADAIDIQHVEHFTHLLTSDGTLYATGFNNYNAKGIVSGNTFEPVTTNVSSFYNTWRCLHVIKNDGSRWAIGSNNDGNLGTGDTTPLSTLTQIDAGPWSKIAAHYMTTIGLKTDGTLWGWGNNSEGKNGTGANRLLPTQIGTDTDWADISVHTSYALALKQNGDLWGWGSNEFSCIYPPAGGDYLSPVFIASGISKLLPGSWIRTNVSGLIV